MFEKLQKLYENNHEEQLEQLEQVEQTEPQEDEAFVDDEPSEELDVSGMDTSEVNPNDSIQEVSAEVTENPEHDKDHKKPQSFNFEEFFDSNSPHNYKPDLSALKNVTSKDDLFDIDHVQQEIENFISNGKDKSISLATNSRNRDPKINKRAMEDFVDYLHHQFSKVIDSSKKITPGSKKLLDELRKSYAIYPNGKIGSFKFLLANKDKFFSGASKKPKQNEEVVETEETVKESRQVPQEEVSRTMIDTSWIDDNNDSYNETADPTLNFNRDSLFEEYMDCFRIYNGIPED